MKNLNCQKQKLKKKNELRMCDVEEGREGERVREQEHREWLKK